MLKAFNSFQMVGMFAGMPFLVSWLTTKPFPYSGVALFAAAVSYVVMFFMLTGAVYSSIEKL